MSETTTTNVFETGKSYFCTSACDHNCRWDFTVTRRTKRSVWLRDGDGKVTMRRVSVYRGEEQVFPLGRYSMAPILGASRVVEESDGCEKCRSWIERKIASKFESHVDAYCGDCGAREIDVRRMLTREAA